jgi:hypothetical protein
MKYPFLVLLFIILLLILAFIISNIIIYKNVNYYGGNVSINNSINPTKYYYSIYNGDMGLVYDELKQLLAQYNFHEAPLTRHVHMSIGSASGVDIYGKRNFKVYIINGKKQYLDPLFVNQKAVIKSVLGGSKSLSYKNKLYETIKNLIPGGMKYIPKTYTIAEFERTLLGKGFTQKSPPPLAKEYLGEASPMSTSETKGQRASGLAMTFILKKINTEQQQGVRVFSTKNEYIQIKKELKINPHNAIIMEYITNPALTIDGKKFHLRMYVLLIVESGIKRCYIHDECWILTAKEKYKKGDWLNSNIHITGAKTTDREYKFPNDINTPIDEKKINEFKKTLAFATTFNTSIVFEENDIGYHIYGVDVLMTDDNNFLILEFNGSNMLGHDCVQGIKNTPECDIFKKRFSKDYFSFILNCTALSVFGIKKRAIPYAEVCGYGVLSPFFNILTGNNRCVLIPYNDASPHDIENAKKIYFHNESIQLNQLLKICNLNCIFLISLSFRERKEAKKEYINERKNSKKEDINEKKNSESEDKTKQSLCSYGDAHASVVGYLALDHNNYITVAVMEEYQNRGIATAMIAQFLEIYAHRNLKNHHNVKDSNDKIYMINKSIFIEKIAAKLHFTLEKVNDINDLKQSFNRYSRPCIIPDITIHKVNTYQLLTYNYIKETNGFNHDLLIKHLNVNMVQTRSQFVHLAYTEINSSKTNSFYTTKASTGSKYDKNFVIQGSELKSALNIKYPNIKIYKEYLDISNNYKNYRNYGIDIPYLHNGYRIDINLFFFLYVSKNGIKKCYYLKDNNIVVKSDILFDDELKNCENTKEKITGQFIPKEKSLKILFKNSDTKYKWPDTFINKDNTEEITSMQNLLNEYIVEIAESIIQLDVIPYSESNSGFNIIVPTIDFIRDLNSSSNSNLKYKPQIRYIYTHIGITGLNDKQYQDEFSRHYYDFLITNIINPHFGLSNKEKPGQLISPLKCVINTELNIDADIVSKLYLKFNTTRNKIEIYINNKSDFVSIGHIELNIDNIDVIVLSHIELDPPYRKKNIAVNIIFILIETLAAYYAPLNISLKILYVKPMFHIAHILQFHKTLFTKRRQKDENDENEEYFIRLCRI